jgi:hypothetical protein
MEPPFRTMADELFEQGEEQGLRKGRLMSSRQNLRELLEKKFGSLPEALIERIEQADDPARLDAAIQQIFEVESPDQLRL